MFFVVYFVQRYDFLVSLCNNLLTFTTLTMKKNVSRTFTYIGNSSIRMVFKQIYSGRKNINKYTSLEDYCAYIPKRKRESSKKSIPFMQLWPYMLGG